MADNHLFILETSGGSRKVVHSIDPVHPFQTISGFFCIAHRGASSYAPENTMPAFQKAVEMKADLIELDVTLTRDNIPVVFHDKNLERTTNGMGQIQNFYLREIRELDAGSWFSSDYKNVSIPTLENLLLWAKGRIALNIEIKKEAVRPNRHGGIEDMLIELLDDFEISNQVIVSSFNTMALQRLQQKAPGIKTAALLSQYSMGTPKALRVMKKTGARGLNMLPRQMGKQLMKIAARDHIPVWVYTIDDESKMRYVIRRGATGIFTNKPDVLRRVVAQEFITN